jgi:hypothetical protein
MTLATPFRLAGFDQRVPPAFEHSTAAWIGAVGPCEDGQWAYAVDAVLGARFDTLLGQYLVDLAVAISPSSPAPGTCVALGPYGICFYFATIQVVSWVLCYEPPPPEPPHGRALGLRPGHRSLRPAATGPTATPRRPRPGDAADQLAALVAQSSKAAVTLTRAANPSPSCEGHPTRRPS